MKDFQVRELDRSVELSTDVLPCECRLLGKIEMYRHQIFCVSKERKQFGHGGRVEVGDVMQYEVCKVRRSEDC